MSEAETTLLFAGTGAADWPGQDSAGEYRAFASLLVDGRLLIDCTLAGLERLRQFSVDAGLISDVFITHSHRDHYQPEALRVLADLRGQGRGRLRVHMDRALAETVADERLEVVPLIAGRQVRAAGYAVLPLRANHSGTVPGETTLHYLFTGPGACFLYATDGAWMLSETWNALQGVRLDALVIDCTIGDGHAGDYRIFEHNSLEMVRIMTGTMQRQNLLKAGASVLLTHLARTLHPGHSQLASTLTEPFIAAYDGYTHILGT